MKNKVALFLMIIAITLSVIPLLNLHTKSLVASNPTPEGAKNTQQTISFYTIDYVLDYISPYLYYFGISSSPLQSIIGYKGWLYLGDKYMQTRTVSRRGQTAEDVSLARNIAFASEAWDAQLQKKGVHLYRVMIAPDKGTIYPEHLPEWAKPSTPSATDALVTCASKLYFDLRPTLLRAKAETPIPLYYKTDTHWNSLGAAHAFNAFMSYLLHTEPGLNWESDQKFRVTQVRNRPGGDLARFLHLKRYLTDKEPVISWLINTSIETTQYDLESNKVIRSGGNPTIRAPQTPIRVASPHALNKKKILWLRDSFGTALSPFMAATFTEVVQVHWYPAFRNHGHLLTKLVDSWHPEYVIVTVVERASRSPEFALLPPENSD